MIPSKLPSELSQSWSRRLGASAVPEPSMAWQVWQVDVSKMVLPCCTISDVTPSGRSMFAPTGGAGVPGAPGAGASGVGAASGAASPHATNASTATAAAAPLHLLFHMVRSPVDSGQR
jgi:hypothetical protein